ncbi:zinc-binding protein A33-like [Rhinoraja longicauda]
MRAAGSRGQRIVFTADSPVKTEVKPGTAVSADILTRYPRGKWIWGCENEQIPMLEAGIDVGGVAVTETHSGKDESKKERKKDGSRSVPLVCRVTAPLSAVHQFLWDCGPRALARLAEKARALSLNWTEKESKLLCEKHQEELKLFCETDKKLICVICRDAMEHKTHSFLPIEEAVGIYKNQVKSSFESLTKKKSEMQQMEQQQQEKISGVLEQSHDLQSQMTSHFADLHQILTEKERRVLADIREEEEKIRRTMEKSLQEIQANLNSIQKELSMLQKQMDQKDNGIFLKEAAGRKRRVRDEVNTLSVTDRALPIEKIHNHFVLNTLWRETCVIQRVSVTLDVETAGPWLEVAEDRKRVRWTRTRRSLRQRQRVRPPWIAGLGSRTFHRPARPKIGRGIFLCWAGTSMSGATTAPTCSNSGSSSVFARPGSDLSSAEPAVFGGCGSGCDATRLGLGPLWTIRCGLQPQQPDCGRGQQEKGKTLWPSITVRRERTGGDSL